jgi:hypothetical protein
MNDFADQLKEITNFAFRYGLDLVKLLSMITDTEPAKQPPVEPPSLDSEPSFEPSSYDPALEPLMTAEEATALNTVKRYWLRQSIGFAATAGELYEKCGMAMPHKHKALSFWMRSPEAKAMVMGERAGRHVYGRVSEAFV